LQKFYFIKFAKILILKICKNFILKNLQIFDFKKFVKIIIKNIAKILVLKNKKFCKNINFKK